MPAATLPAAPPAPRNAGILPSQAIRRLVEGGVVRASPAIGEDQVQPASLDLRLGPVAHRVQASFLPGPGATVAEKLRQFGLHEVSLAGGAVLERGCVYVVPLLESLDLPPDLAAVANPKSSIGRLDVFTRLITDHGAEFDHVRAGYTGPLYAEISPRTFSILVRAGSRVDQLRFRRGEAAPSDEAMRRLQRVLPLVSGAADLEADIKEGVAVSVDLGGSGPERLVGFRARKHTPLIDIDRIGGYAVADYWERITAPLPQGGLVLNPDEFYILSSKEAVTVPGDHAAEMRAYDTRVGEFRVHYAGFFDPGFGLPDLDAAGTRAVLEVRSHDVPFLLEDGQIVCRLVYEPLTEAPDKLYGAGIGSSYQRQGLKLGKHFRG